ncbi:MAG: diphthamide biosynthesis enzyme Dph2 [Candidatus Heimdallarchaeota archaeon]
MYNIQLTKQEISSILDKNNDFKTVMLQFPDGLLDKFSTEIIFFLKKRNPRIKVIVSGDPSYGACDLPINQALYFGLQVDAIFHFGHSTFAFPKPDLNIAIFYFTVDASIAIDWSLIKEELTMYKWKKIGILSTIQHTKILKDAKIHLGSGGYGITIYKEGQILGCNQDRAKKIAKDVDGFLVISGGNFHASPIVVATGKETLRYDPFNKNFQLFDLNYRNLYLKKRYASILKARSAKIWGVLLSLKSGQFPSDAGTKMVNMIENAGKTAVLIPMYRIDPNHLINFNDIDAWVINLCPRIATDDFVSFNKPILTARELMVTLGLLDWEVFTNFNVKDQLLILETE